MQNQFDFFAYGKQVRGFTTSLMSSGSNAMGISGRMHLLAVAAERDLARFGRSAATSRVACGPGCGVCCVVNVTILMPEAVTITWFLQRHFSAEQLEGLRSRLQELLRLTRWLDDEERLFLRKPCAFLDEHGSCIIHTVRPLLCRAMTSTDPKRCRDAIAMVPLAGAPSVEMDLFQKKLIETVYCELAGSLEDLGLDHRPRRLSAAVLMLLAEPEMITLYANGENVPIH
ncbi:MAG: YkgJ family cysteine cluster protein [Desulfuromonadales bacterium]|nr:YkgJ family cysteine cluster protein [Desulfuromonadales bacterium]